MNATSFFSLDTPAGATVPQAADTVVPSDASTSGDADLFAALVDEALVRAGQGPVDPPSSQPVSKSAGTGRPAIVSGTKLPGVQALVEGSPVVGEEGPSVPAESSDPERPKSELSEDLNLLLLSQSAFVAPTLPVTWVVPSVIPAVSTETTGDAPPVFQESASRGETQSSIEMVEPSRGSPARTGNVTTATYDAAALPPERIQPRMVGEIPQTDREPAGSSLREPMTAKSGQADPSTPIAGPAPSGVTGNGGRLDLVELGFQPAVEVGLPPPAKSLDASVPSQPVAKVLPPTRAALPDLPAVTANALRFTTAPAVPMQTPPVVAEQGRPTVAVAESESSSSTEAAAIIVASSSRPAVQKDATQESQRRVKAYASGGPVKVDGAPVQTMPVMAGQGTHAEADAESDLPSASGEAAIVAQSLPEAVVQKNASQKNKEAVKAHAGAGFLKVDGASPQMREHRGTRVAKEELRMESLSNAEQAGTGPMTGGTDDVTEASPSTGAGPMLRDRDADNAEFSRDLAADWQTGRPVSHADRPASDSQAVRGPEAARTVEQLSGLVMRETAVLKQHTPDSMAVVLRPDANTELFMHLTQRDGHIEASVRCERGNFDQINALWPQLQESLAGQKVRLAPLQESTVPQRDPQGAPSNTMNFSESEQRSRRQSMPEDDSTSDRPSSAPPSTVSLHPERRRSGTRPTASRPGWETWA